MYLAIDTETGSLSPKTGDLLTLYAAIFDENFKLLDEIDLKLKPENNRLPIASAEALDINKINIKEHLSNPETIDYFQAKEKFITLIKKHFKKSGRYSNIRPIGYNLLFDVKFIQAYILPEEEWEKLINYNNIDPKIIVNFLKDSEWLSSDVGTLISAVKYFNIPMGIAHTAKEDALATVEVYKKLLDLMASKKENGSQSVDLIDLLEKE